MFDRSHRRLSVGVAVAALSLLAPIVAGATTIGSASVTFSTTGLPMQSGPVNYIDLTGDVGASSVTSGGATITLGNAASAIVQGSLSGYYAAPVAGGTSANPTLWTAPYIAAECTGVYCTNGSIGSVKISFSTPQTYFGLLWGSIGTGDLLNFYSNGTLVDSLSGSQVIAAAGVNIVNGSQGFGGSDYTLVNLLNGLTFNSVAIEQTSSNSFEAADFEYAAQAVAAVPEPASFAILGLGLMGLVIAVRRRNAA